MARIKKMESGGKSALGMKSVKAGFDKNPGVTRADIIVAAKKEAKDGKKVKKAQVGSKVALRTGQLKRVGRLAAKNPDKAEKVAGKMVERASRRQRGKEYIQKNLSELMPKSKSGSKVKKARSGATLSPSNKSTSSNLAGYKRVIGKSMRMGGSMKKCRGGCY
jgi:ribosomal protein L14